MGYSDIVMNDNATATGEAPRRDDSAGGSDYAEGTHLFVVPWRLDHPGGVDQVVFNLCAQFSRQRRTRPLVLSQTTRADSHQP